jgi:hypothetical protein
VTIAGIPLCWWLHRVFPRPVRNGVGRIANVLVSRVPAAAELARDREGLRRPCDVGRHLMSHRGRGGPEGASGARRRPRSALTGRHISMSSVMCLVVVATVAFRSHRRPMVNGND